MKAAAVILGLIVLAGLIATAAMSMFAPRQRVAPIAALEPVDRVTDLSLGAFSLTDQDGSPVSEADLLGQLTIVDFIFTNCTLACPMMTTTMSGVQRRLADTDVRFLSITLDPARDTSDRLRAYGASYGADFDRWRFATGKRELIWEMAEGRMSFAIEEDTSLMLDLEDGTKMANIAHPSHFILVGPDGRVLDLFRSSDPDEVERLERHVRRALRVAASRGG